MSEYTSDGAIKLNYEMDIPDFITDIQEVLNNIESKLEQLDNIADILIEIRDELRKKK